MSGAQGEPYSRKPCKLPFVPLRLAFLAFALHIVGCTSSHFVRPLGKGNGVVHASLGGPFVQALGTTLPAPIFSLGGGYGVRDDMEVILHADLTGAAFGILHLEPGFVLHPLVRDGGWVPTLTVATTLHILTNFSDVRAVPQLTGAAAWRIKQKHLVYLGADLGFGFQPSGFSPLWGPFAGGEARIGRVGISLELKWIAPHRNVAFAAPAWVSPSSQGYLSLLLGLNVYLGKVK
jgi:hypothetical protein